MVQKTEIKVLTELKQNQIYKEKQKFTSYFKRITFFTNKTMRVFVFSTHYLKILWRDLYKQVIILKLDRKKFAMKNHFNTRK